MKRFGTFKSPFHPIFASFSLSLTWLLYGCGESASHHSHDDDDHNHSQHVEVDDHGHDHVEVISITQFTEKSELFMEHGQLVQGRSEQLIIHLTRIPEFAPVTEGTLEIRLVHPSGETYTVSADAPVRDGIYLPTITPTFSGEVSMELHLRGSQLEDVHVLDFVEVFPSVDKLPHDHPEDSENPNEIAFLKEQQWKIDYETVVATRRPIQNAVSSIAHLRLPINGQALVPAPVGGIVSFENSETNMELGSGVRKGQVLLTIEPDASWTGGLSKLVEEYQLAKAELSRVESLKESNAVSDKRVLEAQIKYQTLRTAVDKTGWQSDLDDFSNLHTKTNSPLDGILTEVYVKPGERVEAGDPLALITNTSQLILEAHVVLARLSPDSPVTDASFKPAGRENIYKLSSHGGQLLTQTPLIKDGSGVALLRFMFDNSTLGLYPGTKGTANLLSGDSEEMQLTVPMTSIHEEEGIPIVYVQTAGETIEKRYPKLGVNDGYYVQVFSGIFPGERIVTKGAPFIRIASLSTSEMGHGHAH